MLIVVDYKSFIIIIYCCFVFYFNFYPCYLIHKGLLLLSFYTWYLVPKGLDLIKEWKIVWDGYIVRWKNLVDSSEKTFLFAIQTAI